MYQTTYKIRWSSSSSPSQQEAWTSSANASSNASSTSTFVYRLVGPSMDMHQKKRWTRNWQQERGRARNNDKTDAQLTKELMYPNLTDEGTDVSLCTPLTLPQLPNWRGHRHEPMYPTGRTPTTELTWAQTLACVPHWGLPLQPLVQGIWILTTIINRNTHTEGQTHKGDIHTEGTFIVHGVTYTRRALLT